MTRITKSDLGTAAVSAGLDAKEGGRFLRHVRLSLRTGGEADGAMIIPGTVLNTRFLTRNVDATASSAIEAAGLSMSGGDLVLSLPVARRIRRVRLKAPDGGDRIAAYRFDGQAVSQDPVKTASHGTTGAHLNVTDSKLILKRRNGGEFALSSGAIDAVLLRYTPVNPRLSLRLANEPASDIPFPVQTNADGDPVFPAAGTFGPGLEVALAALLRRLPTPLPDPIEFDLVLSADQPCSARIDALDLSVMLEKRGFPEKTVLRFAGSQRETHTVPLSLPSGATLSGGKLTLTVSGTPPVQIVHTDPALPQPSNSGEGLNIADGTPVATRMVLNAAIAVAGAEVLVAAPDGTAMLRAVLIAEKNGQPGAVLAESAPQNITTASPKSVAFTFAPTALPAGPVWLALTALTGRSIAMLGGQGQIARGTAAGFVIAEDDFQRGIIAALRPVARPTAGKAEGGPTIALGAALLSGLPAAGSGEFDLTPFFSSDPVPAALRVSSAARAIVTIDPPLIRYGLS